MKIYSYIRISKDTSDMKNQRFQINEYAMKNYNKLPDEEFNDLITGKKKANERELGKLLAKMIKGDILIIASTSRYGRNFFDVMLTAAILYEKDAQLYAIQQNFEFSKDNSMAKPMMALFAWMDEADRENISMRTSADIKRRKAEGIYNGGRKKGSVKETDEKRLKEFNKAIERGENRKEVLSKVLQFSRPTLNKFLLNNPDIEAKRKANQPSARKAVS